MAPSFRGQGAIPPEKGSFPLDHYGECADAMKAYLKCMEESESNAFKCRELSKEYLVCRMDK